MFNKGSIKGVFFKVYEKCHYTDKAFRQFFIFLYPFFTLPGFFDTNSFQFAHPFPISGLPICR